MTSQTVYVCTATGTQGEALARQLVASGWEVHTTTRNPESPVAKALADLGVKVTQGGWEDETALKSSIAGCKYLFLNLFPDFSDTTNDLKRATRILTIAKEAGAKHVIYSSDFGIPYEDDGSGNSFLVAALKSKPNIERATANAGFETWTVLRPGYFMANFVLPKSPSFFSRATEGIFDFAYPADTGLPIIDHEDIAKFAIAVFQDPPRFHGRTIRIASEVRTAEKIMDALARAAGVDLQAVYLTPEELAERAKVDPILPMHAKLLPAMESLVEMDEVRSWGIPLGNLESYLAREKAAVEATFKNCTKKGMTK